jgi:hypothetical protein
VTSKGYTDKTGLFVMSHLTADYQFSQKVMFSESEVFKLHTKNKKEKSPPFFIYFLCRNTDFSLPEFMSKEATFKNASFGTVSHVCCFGEGSHLSQLTTPKKIPVPVVNPDSV